MNRHQIYKTFAIAVLVLIALAVILPAITIAWSIAKFLVWAVFMAAIITALAWGGHWVWKNHIKDK